MNCMIVLFLELLTFIRVNLNIWYPYLIPPKKKEWLYWCMSCFKHTAFINECFVILVTNKLWSIDKTPLNSCCSCHIIFRISFLPLVLKYYCDIHKFLSQIISFLWSRVCGVLNFYCDTLYHFIYSSTK